MSARRVSWFSCGAASAIATKLSQPDDIVYCETGSEHYDNKRFEAECIRWFNRPVEHIKSEEYSDTWDVWEKTRWLAGINGARCTTELKVIPRLIFQRPSDIHIFGYTADGPDVKRAERLAANYPELRLEFPLIERGITKEACLAMIEGAGIEIPAMYKLGYPNNNCIPCVKATSSRYWALVRKTHPEEFDRMAKLSRELNVRLCRINVDGTLVRAFIDEIPLNHPTTNALVPSCDFLCHIAEGDLADA
ncbi:MAG: hypothetical protein COB78_10710 [Hyphomicrobiales bacterium]|nr:MAG: hypothetical protein COB78_10710 [Hyphomicrobiales bacterium]